MSSPSDPYYSNTRSGRARWPLSRIVRYTIIFTMGVLTGRGLVAGPIYIAAPPQTSQAAEPLPQPIPQTSRNTAAKDASSYDVESAMREAIRAEFARIERRLAEMEARIEASATPNRRPAHDQPAEGDTTAHLAHAGGS